MNKMVIAVVRHELLEKVAEELRRDRIHFTYSEVMRYGGEVRLYHEDTHVRIRIEVIVEEGDVEKVRDIILSKVPKGIPGAGILAVYALEEFMDFSEME